MPDITVEERARITILDIACPYNLYIFETHELKLEKYKSLQTFIAKEIMPFIVDAVIIKSLGTVHKNALKVMVDMGIPK